LDPGAVAHPGAKPVSETPDVCDRCGMATVVERKCKVICLNCGTILKSCADL
jgi:hypothetical protein